MRLVISSDSGVTVCSMRAGAASSRSTCGSLLSWHLDEQRLLALALHALGLDHLHDLGLDHDGRVQHVLDADLVGLLLALAQRHLADALVLGALARDGAVLAAAVDPAADAVGQAHPREAQRAGHAQRQQRDPQHARAEEAQAAASTAARGSSPGCRRSGRRARAPRRCRAASIRAPCWRTAAAPGRPRSAGAASAARGRRRRPRPPARATRARGCAAPAAGRPAAATTRRRRAPAAARPTASAPGRPSRFSTGPPSPEVVKPGSLR